MNSNPIDHQAPAGTDAPSTAGFSSGPHTRNDESAALVCVDRLVRHYRLPREKLFGPQPVVRALNGVSFDVQAGHHLGIVGESGSGKSTLARAVMALEPATAGSVHIFGQDLASLSPSALREARRHFQMVFQDPYGSLDPRQKVARIVTEPLSALDRVDADEQHQRALQALQSVGLRASDLDKYPHEFSGGQRQRIAIARALITRPRLIVADEPVSALDVSVQAQVLNLLQDLAQQHGLTYMLISHDLAVVDHLCDEVAVLYKGRIVEQGNPEQLFHQAAHPYTRSLLAAVPRAEPGRRRLTAHARAAAAQTGQLPGQNPVPQPAQAHATSASSGLGGPLPIGCDFADRCPRVHNRCRVEAPLLRTLRDKHRVACHDGESVLAQTDAHQ